MSNPKQIKDNITLSIVKSIVDNVRFVWSLFWILSKTSKIHTKTCKIYSDLAIQALQILLKAMRIESDDKMIFYIDE